jgi:hypothetical protein
MRAKGTSVFNCNGNRKFRYRSDINIKKLFFEAMYLFIGAFAAFMDLFGLPVFGMLMVDAGVSKNLLDLPGKNISVGMYVYAEIYYNTRKGPIMVEHSWHLCVCRDGTTD